MYLVIHFSFQDIKGEMIIEDITGKPLTAMKVFAASIKALMQHLFGIFEKRDVKLERNDIRWVLTVPAIWSEAAKQFMRKSAELVGVGVLCYTILSIVAPILLYSYCYWGCLSLFLICLSV